MIHGHTSGETWGSFSSDGNSFCFFQRGYAYITENTDQGWTVPKPIKSIPYGTAAYCCLSPDANSIYFMHIDDPSKQYHPFRCQRTSDGWSTPQELGRPLSSPTRELGLSLTADNSIYFTSDADHGGRFQYAPLVGNTWPQGIKIPLEQGKLHCCHPGIAPDESFMVFYSIKPGALPGTETDLYLTLRRPDGTWTKPRNMGRPFCGQHLAPSRPYLLKSPSGRSGNCPG